MANEKFTGTVIVRRNGVSIRSRKGSAKLNLGGSTKTPVISDDQVIGYREEYSAPTIECVLEHNNNTPDQEIKEGTEDTIRFETTSGVSYVMANAVCSEPLDLQGGEGGMTVKWFGSTVTKE